MYRHLIWPNRWTVTGYAIRRLFITPAPTSDRCVMGSPVHPWLWCPRKCLPDEIWCARHMRPH